MYIVLRQCHCTLKKICICVNVTFTRTGKPKKLFYCITPCIVLFALLQDSGTKAPASPGLPIVKAAILAIALCVAVLNTFLAFSR